MKRLAEEGVDAEYVDQRAFLFPIGIVRVEDGISNRSAESIKPEYRQLTIIVPCKPISLAAIELLQLVLEEWSTE